ncbi:MAG: hypothetical protein ACXIUW_08015 [Roseinatronobacter sp.]
MTQPMTQAERDAITALVRLLQDEIAAIRKGDLAQVSAHAGRKAELGAVVEAASPAIAAALAADAPEAALKTQIATLRDLIDTDRTLLERMTQATGDLVTELARLRDRHGLRGIYGATGTSRGSDPLPVQRFDQSV